MELNILLCLRVNSKGLNVILFITLFNNFSVFVMLEKSFQRAGICILHYIIHMSLLFTRQNVGCCWR